MMTRKLSVALVVMLVTSVVSAENFPDAVSRTAMTTSIVTTNFYTAAPAGMYRACWYLHTTVAGTAGTVLLNISWHDGIAAQTFQIPAALSLTILTGPQANCVVLWSGAQQNISYSTTAAGLLGSPQYAVRISLERLQ